MSYNVNFKVKVENVDAYVSCWGCNSGITWNCSNVISQSTGLDWNSGNNGLCKDVLVGIYRGLANLKQNPDMYRQYEKGNGYGSVETATEFFKSIIEDWEEFEKRCPEFLDFATFWLE